MSTFNSITQILKITQSEKMRFFLVNELKLTQCELLSLFHFKNAAAYVS